MSKRIYQIQHDATSKWSDVSQSEYENWEDYKRIVVVEIEEWGRKPRPSDFNLVALVKSLTSDFLVMHSGLLDDDQNPLKYTVHVPKALMEKTRALIYENAPAYLSINVVEKTAGPIVAQAD